MSVSNALCGGNQGFVWRADQRQVLMFSPTEGDGWNNPTSDVQFNAIDEAELVNVEQRNSTSWGVWVQDVQTLTDTAVLTIDSTLDVSNPACGDLGNQEPLLNYLRTFLRNTSITGCADVVPYCGLPDGQGGMGFAARMLCSETCGCTDPAGEFIHTGGCPYGVGRPCWFTGDFVAKLRQPTCKEKTAEELRNQTAWVQWVDAIKAYGASKNDLRGKREATLLSQAMWDHGCAFGDNMSAANITWGDCSSWNFDWAFKTVAFFCPQTCNCGVGTADSTCPRPRGMSCDELRTCLAYGEDYICPGDIPSVVGEVEVNFETFTTADLYEEEILEAIQRVLARAAGNGIKPEEILVYFEQRRRLRVTHQQARRLSKEDVIFHIFLMSEFVDTEAIKQSLQSYTDAQGQAYLIELLRDAGVPAELELEFDRSHSSTYGDGDAEQEDDEDEDPGEDQSNGPDGDTDGGNYSNNSG